ncbi:MAG TPA: inositol monophosphatase family protein [Bacillota bacterium]|nr:inositol monophosphatase family protein [Bacillota bacterium]
MKESLRDDIYETAKRWIYEAGAYIKENLDAPMTIDTKSNPNDLVTEMDKAIERFFVNKIKDKYSEHFIFGEEGYGDEIISLEGTVWIIDPIDGTMNFVHQKRNFAISIGIYHEGIGEIGLIYDVMRDDLYDAIRGEGAFKNGVQLPMLDESVTLNESIIAMNHRWLCENSFINEKVMQQLVKDIRGNRTYGSAALEFAYVAEGVIDGYIAMRLAPWDIAAGMIIVNEVGGRTANNVGEAVNLLTRNMIVTCNPSLLNKLINDYIKKGKK